MTFKLVSQAINHDRLGRPYQNFLANRESRATKPSRKSPSHGGMIDMLVKIIDAGPMPGVAWVVVADRQDAEEFIKREKALNALCLADEGASVSFEIVEDPK